MEAKDDPGAAAGAVSAMLDTADPVVTAAWNDVQCAQVDFALAIELTVFYTSAHWERAKTVLDIGTGNGYYLRSLAERFPGKAYLGIDRSRELIDIARRVPAAHVRYEWRDLAEATGEYDVTIMRLFLQHQRDADASLVAASRLTRRGGAVIVFDAYDQLRFFRPNLPRFRAFFQAYSEAQRAQGFDRDVALALATGQRVVPGLRLAEHSVLIVPSTLPGNLDRFRSIYGTFLTMVQRAGEVSVDFESVRAEWHDWSVRDDAYAQIGVTALTLERL